MAEHHWDRYTRANGVYRRLLPHYPRKGLAFRTRKVFRDLCEKSYNSSRKEWYYGIKLHAVVARKPGLLPIPVSLMASGAAQHDLPAAKQIIEDHASLMPGKLYADKAYMDADWAQSLKQSRALELLTPRACLKNKSCTKGKRVV